jgi:hypothetical protein
VCFRGYFCYFIAARAPLLPVTGRILVVGAQTALAQQIEHDLLGGLHGSLAGGVDADLRVLRDVKGVADADLWCFATDDPFRVFSVCFRGYILLRNRD